MKKQLNLAVVKYAALFLIESQGNTTTLDVKSLLRDYDYHASQREVSQLMDQSCQELPLEYDTPGDWRVYKIPAASSLAMCVVNDLQDDEDDNTIVSDLSQINTIPYVPNDVINDISYWYYIRNDGDRIVLLDQGAHLKYGWKLTSTSKPNIVVYSPKINTRDQVRQAYASIFEVPFHSVRASHEV